MPPEPPNKPILILKINVIVGAFSLAKSPKEWQHMYTVEACYENTVGT